MMDDKKLAFETAMTQAAAIAKVGLSDEDYKLFLARFSEAWATYDAAVASSVKPKKEPKDKRFSLSLTLGFRREG